MDNKHRTGAEKHDHDSFTQLYMVAFQQDMECYSQSVLTDPQEEITVHAVTPGQQTHTTGKKN